MLLMGSPRPPAPMKVARVAVPTLSTSATRMPATITGTASGISTLSRVCLADIPMPRAASMSAGSTCSSPTTVFVSTGRNDARTRAMIAVVVPNPSRKASKMITP